VLVILELRALGDVETHAGEDLDQLLAHTHDDVPAPEGAALDEPGSVMSST